jgi:hypothetical protein
MAMPEKTKRRLDDQDASLLEPWIQALGPLLDIEETRQVLHLEDAREVIALQLQGLLLTLGSIDGQNLYPAFQFSPSGKPYPEIARTLEIFARAVETPYTIASWLVSPRDNLEDKTPSAWLQAGGDPTLFFEAARRAAWRLAQ